jgi:hypothetical protein
LKLDWRSPLSEDNYKEYRDTEFLRKLSLLHLAQSLRNFWPKGGPVWDGLAIAHGADGDFCVLFEAKSHIPELNSVCTATSATSTETIRTQISSLPGEELRILRVSGRRCRNRDWMGGGLDSLGS